MELISLLQLEKKSECPGKINTSCVVHARNKNLVWYFNHETQHCHIFRNNGCKQKAPRFGSEKFCIDSCGGKAFYCYSCTLAFENRKGRVLHAPGQIGHALFCFQTPVFVLSVLYGSDCVAW